MKKLKDNKIVLLMEAYDPECDTYLALRDSEEMYDVV